MQASPTRPRRRTISRYDATPDILKPSTYDVTNGTYWYLGAFSYDLPLPTTYYPAAWIWFNERDANITNPLERPAYLSWWDYGFEAIQAGDIRPSPTTSRTAIIWLHRSSCVRTRPAPSH